ncbi:MAG: hypothetical protein DMF94_34315 [Acidobacteria bacterium]|nr:MAG: hypothetical protein DMF96_31430 [Acidobacteriota bacterium]PYR14421.1 MAG: hypothetical protein DMF94_34315 [Acidobacteriota bacterium]
MLVVWPNVVELMLIGKQRQTFATVSSGVVRQNAIEDDTAVVQASPRDLGFSLGAMSRRAKQLVQSAMASLKSQVASLNSQRRGLSARQ